MLNDRLVLLGVVGLAAVATAGWMRTPAVLPAGSMVSGFQPVAQELVFDPGQQALPVTMVRHGAGDRMVTRARRAPIAYDDRYIDDRDVMVEKTRSKKASAAIIGGGAAAGAAIGGLAGGGKGAIIGAVGGGAAGLVYDRMTAKKQVPARDEDYRYRSTTADDRPEGRSTAKRATIIGGSAAAGAAIGAAAGGGKGAAIGALGGGAAGYIYDRMTKDR